MSEETNISKQNLDQEAIKYHSNNPPGKLEIVATKPLMNRRDLSLAYSPGVAAVSELIHDQPEKAHEVTGRSNLIGVISNGTAVLGLGDIGPLASKPVMEGKAVLFKRFARINVFDIEVDETDIDKFCDVVASLEPTFGGINLEDIKAPECFEIEERLKKKMKIPVFHDDQHGTAIVSGAALLNGVTLVGKDISRIRVVCSGAGAAALSCITLFSNLGIPKENIIMCDSKGVINQHRDDLNEYKKKFLSHNNFKNLKEALVGADVFLGLSTGGVVNEEMVKSMAPKPLIFALANPTPEIMPDLAKKVAPDCIVASGRSDFPNQVNNVLCFPYIFRGALDVGATTINDEMKMACTVALAELARKNVDEELIHAYGEEKLGFGPDMIIPKPFDPRLMLEVAPAVAKAAMDTGVATRPLADLDSYRQNLEKLVYPASAIMQNIIYTPTYQKKKIIFSDGEDHRILQVAKNIIEEDIAHPILIGRKTTIEAKIEELTLSIKPKNYTIFDPQTADLTPYTELHHQLRCRKGVSPLMSEIFIRSNNTVLGSLMLKKGEGNSLICGIEGRFIFHLKQVNGIIGSEVPRGLSTMHMIMSKGRPLFITDTQINVNPSVEELVQITLSGIKTVKQFGLKPKVALLSFSHFGSANLPETNKMSKAVEILQRDYPDLEIEGEMRGDMALHEPFRKIELPGNKLEGEANLLVMPNLDAANISFNLLKMTTSGGFSLGPILLGAKKSVHIVTGLNSVRGIYNMAVYSLKQHSD